MNRTGMVSLKMCVTPSDSLKKKEPLKHLAAIERAIEAIEKRYAEWPRSPGSQSEIQATLNSILALQKSLKEFKREKGAMPN
jgi:hypothetical protein